MAYRQTIFEEWTHAHEAAASWPQTSALSVFALAHLADIMLRVELKAEPADEIELRFEEIDVVFLVRWAGRPVTDIARMGGVSADTSTVLASAPRHQKCIDETG
jgi:hypothetical protein